MLDIYTAFGATNSIFTRMMRPFLSRIIFIAYCFKFSRFIGVVESSGEQQDEWQIMSCERSLLDRYMQELAGLQVD